MSCATVEVSGRLPSSAVVNDQVMRITERERGWRALLKRKSGTKECGVKGCYYSPVRFWRWGGEEVVELKSTGRLRVEARQERHQSLLSRSLTHKRTHCCLSGGRSRSPETAAEEQGRLKSCRFFSRTTTLERYRQAI